jgi:hypothetical protein
MRRITSIGFVIALLLAFAGVAIAAGPSFQAAIWGDGQLWSTKGLSTIPAPNSHNVQSFDKLYVIINSNNPLGQLPVAEAAPGNRNYNGGRWFTHTVEWTQAGFDAYGGTVPVLTSYDEIMDNYNMGYLDITPGSFVGGPLPYFECPLLPVK